MGQYITYLGIFHPNISIRSPVRVDILFLDMHPFLDLLLNFSQKGHFVPSLPNFYSFYEGIKSGQEKEKVTTILRLYVKPT